MIKDITFSEFVDEFQALRPENFTYDGLRLLFDYLEEYEECTGAPFELDVIALCCDFIEMDADEIIEYYGLSDEFRSEFMESASWRNYGNREPDMLADYLKDQTTYCGHKNGIYVFQAF